MNWQKISTIIGIVVALSSLVGGAIAYDNSIMSMEEAQTLHISMSKDYQVQLDLVLLQTLEWKLDDIVRELKLNPMDPVLLNRFQYYQDKIDKIKERIDKNTSNAG